MRRAHGLVAVFVATTAVATTVLAQNKPEPILNAEEHLAKDEAWKSADLAKKFEMLKKLQDEKKLDSSQVKWTQVRALLAEARAKKIDKDDLALAKWMGEIKRESSKSPIWKNGYQAVDELIDLHGTRRLYADEAFAKGDLAAKLKRVKELWNARELGQTTTYSLTNDLVYRALIPAGGDVDKELAIFGELYRKDVMVWDSSASIHRALLVRGLHEKKELDTTEKKLAWIATVTKDKQGDLSWMTVGSTRVMLLVEVIDADPEFTKLDAAGRKAKIEEWVKAGTLGFGDKSSLLGAYASTK